MIQFLKKGKPHTFDGCEISHFSVREPVDIKEILSLPLPRSSEYIVYRASMSRAAELAETQVKSAVRRE